MLNLLTPNPIPTADAGSLIVTADGNISGMAIQLLGGAIFLD